MASDKFLELAEKSIVGSIPTPPTLINSMNDMFTVGNVLTTNGTNALRVVDANESDVAFRDLLNDDL